MNGAQNNIGRAREVGQAPATSQGIYNPLNRVPGPGNVSAPGFYQTFAVPPPIRNLSFSQTTGPVSVFLLAENPDRRYLNIVNTGAALVYVAFGTVVAPDGSNAIPIAPGGYYEMTLGTRSAVAFLSFAGSSVVINEGILDKQGW